MKTDQGFDISVNILDDQIMVLSWTEFDTYYENYRD